MKKIKIRRKDKGFTVAEVLISIIVFALMATAMAQAFTAVDNVYARTRQLYEIYTVLSACPEIDRALQYEQVTGSVQCFPNNTFAVEGGGSGTIVYNPSLTVTQTSDLPGTDALRNVPNAKVVEVKVNYLNPVSSPWDIRLLISRNGIGQL
jgi:prepilin-type N-terminal cleavage/methylation domain-containing protein